MRLRVLFLLGFCASPAWAGDLSIGSMSLNPYSSGPRLTTSALSASSYTRTKTFDTKSYAAATRTTYSGRLRRASPSPMVKRALDKVVARYGLRPEIAASGLDKGRFSKLFKALIQHESGFNPRAVSPKGAMGLGQIMPGTAADLGLTRPFAIDENLDAAARYLLRQLRTFRDPALALAAYNAGPGAVKRYDGIPPYKETQAYVAAISSVVR